MATHSTADRGSSSPQEPSRRPGYDQGGIDDYAGISSAGQDSEEQVRADRDFAEMIVDTVREGLLVLDLDLRVRAANASFYHTFDVTEEATVGRPVYELGEGQWDLPELRRLLEDILPRKHTFDGYVVEHDFARIGWRRMCLNARQMDDHALILLAIEDVTTQAHGEAALRASEERFEAVANLVPDLLWCSAPNGYATWYNQRWIEYTGTSAEKARGLGWMKAVHPEDRARALEAQRAAAETGHDLEAAYRIRAASGAYRWFLVRAVPIRDASGEVLEWYGSATDVHEQRCLLATLEERVEERTAQVHKLAATLTAAEHRERARIAQILHDDLQQRLYGIEVRLRLTRHAAGHGQPEQVETGLAAMETWVKECIALSRNLAVDLNPPVLKSEGLARALRWLAPRMRELHDLEVEVMADEALTLPGPDVRELLFQIVRELLFNVAKHAQTRRAVVELRRAENAVEVTVRDEGQGFDVAEVRQQAAAGEGLGLFSVQERIGLMGGELCIDSAPGAGTRVTLRLPLTLP